MFTGASSKEFWPDPRVEHNVHRGSPLNALTGIDNSLVGVSLDRPNVIRDPYLHLRDLNSPERFNRSSFAPNPVGTFGNLGALSVYGPRLAANDPRILQFSLKYTF